MTAALVPDTLLDRLAADGVLTRAVQRNPALIEAAVRLHQDGHVPANTWLIDLDVIAANARALAAEAGRFGLSTYTMSKQYARNPMVTAVARASGLGKVVAVDVQCAQIAHRYQLPIGHVGHLNQVPKAFTSAVLAMKPEVITVFTVEAAERISAAAAGTGRTQELLLRPVAEGDVFFEGQEGGFPEAEIVECAQRISALPNVTIVGLTSFPCIRYNLSDAAKSAPVLNPNAATLRRVAQRLVDAGFEMRHINMPGNTSTETMPLFAEAGATHVEPGHGLLGSTPNHLFDNALPELPSYVYVSEVSHHVGDRAYAFGGGLWTLLAGFLDEKDKPVRPIDALVGASAEEAYRNVLRYVPVDQIIDYHAPLVPGANVRVGDTVVMGFYTQMQMNRSYTAAVSGIATGQPRVEGLFDVGANLLDDSGMPVPLGDAIATVNALAARYAGDGGHQR
jgi:predicted amino acid racemase